MRGQGAQGFSMTRKADITRRQFLTGAYRERNAALSEAETLTRDPARQKLAEPYGLGWQEDPRFSRDFTAPETAPQVPDWDDGIERVLEEMEDLKGIEDF